MLRIALTGGIATGKSYVLARLRERGIPTIDADEIVHEQFGAATATTQAIAREFGPGVLKPDGSVERSALGSKVFGDPASRLRLEALVHPIVYERIRQWFDTVHVAAAVASIPLLYETRHESDFDVVLVTACTEEQQVSRIMDRGLSHEDARRRIQAQMPVEEKARRADYVIRTSGAFAETNAQVDEFLAKVSARPG